MHDIHVVVMPGSTCLLCITREPICQREPYRYNDSLCFQVHGTTFIVQYCKPLRVTNLILTPETMQNHAFYPFPYAIQSIPDSIHIIMSRPSQDLDQPLFLDPGPQRTDARQVRRVDMSASPAHHGSSVDTCTQRHIPCHA